MVSILTGRDHLSPLPHRAETSNFVVMGSRGKAYPQILKGGGVQGKVAGKWRPHAWPVVLHLISQIPSLHPWSSPGGSDDEESSCNAGDLGSDLPRVGKILRREWQPTPVFLPGEFHGQRSLVGYSPWGHKRSDRTE